MPRPVHFEIHADDPARAMRFYEAVFGWKFQQWGDVEYWMVTTGADDEPGINGGLVPRQGGTGDRVVAYVCTMDVSDLDAMMEQVLAHGGSVALPKQDMGGVGWLAYLKDPDDNIFGLLQNVGTPD